MDFTDYLRNERAYERRLRKHDPHVHDESIFKTMLDTLYKPELERLTEVDVRWCGIPFVECNGLLLPRDIANKDGWGAQTTAYGKCNMIRSLSAVSAVEHRRLYLGKFDDDTSPDLMRETILATKYNPDDYSHKVDH